MTNDAPIREAISANVLRLLGERGLSQSALSRMTGDPLMTINDLANGRCTPNIGTLQRVAEALEVSVNELLEPAKKSRRAS